MVNFQYIPEMVEQWQWALCYAIVIFGYMLAVLILEKEIKKDV